MEEKKEGKKIKKRRNRMDEKKKINKRKIKLRIRN